MGNEVLINILFIIILLMGSALAVILFNRTSHTARVSASEEKLRELEENMEKLSKEIDELKKEIIALRKELSEEP